MTALGRTLALTRTSVPFTLTSYDAAFSSPSGSGAIVTAESALHVATVYACVSIISETLATLPLGMYQHVDPDGKRAARNHPLDELLGDQPNDYQTAVEFRETMTAFALLRDRAVAEIKAGPRGPVDQLVPLHPDLVWREVTPGGAVRYRYNDPVANRQRILDASQVFVVGARFGKSVLAYARDSIGLAAAQDTYASQLFRRGARPSGTLTIAKGTSPKARRNLRRALDRYSLSGQYSGRPMLLEEGMTWQSVGINNKDAEFLDSRKFSVAEIARWFRVPLHKVQDLERSTNNNIEQQASEFVTDTVRPWAVRWEQCIRRDLILAKAIYFAEHNLEGLLRGDQKSRAEYYATSIQWGWMNPDEVRAKENLNPRDDGLGDQYVRPVNYYAPEDGPLVSAVQPVPQSPPAQQSPGAVAHLRAMTGDQAARVVRKETATLAKLAERTGASGEAWEDGVRAFYREHTDYVARLLRLPYAAAETYTQQRRAAVLAGDAEDDDQVEQLTTLALTTAEQLSLVAAA